MYNLAYSHQYKIYPTMQPARHPTPTNQPTNYLIASCTLDLSECFDRSGNDLIWIMHLRISFINKITHSFLASPHPLQIFKSTKSVET
jgi:hypothetical protein